MKKLKRNNWVNIAGNKPLKISNRKVVLKHAIRTKAIEKPKIVGKKRLTIGMAEMNEYSRKVTDRYKYQNG